MTLEPIAADLRSAARRVVRAPALAAAVLVTLAPGLGLTVAIFSVVNAALLRPLPYRDPDRLVRVYTAFPGMRLQRMGLSGPEALELASLNTPFEATGTFYLGSVAVTGGTEPIQASAAYCTAGLFETLGVPPLLGRAIEPDDRVGAHPVALLGHGLWRRAFGGDPGIVGRVLEIDGVIRTIAGVMPPRFDLLDAGVGVWLPLQLEAGTAGSRANHFYQAIARLRDGLTGEQAAAALDADVARWRDAVDEFHVPAPRLHPLSFRPLHDDMTGAARPALLLVAGAVALVLLIAAANVANLLLASTEARAPELAVRAALGASPARLARQLVTECLALSLIGGAAAVPIGRALVAAIVAIGPSGVPRLREAVLDWRVLLFAFGASMAAGLLFSLAPLLRIRRAAPSRFLRADARAATGSRRRRAAGSLLLVGEIALAVTLVSAAALMARTVASLLDVSTGFDATGVLRVSVSAPRARYPAEDHVFAFFDAVLARLREIPGVRSVAAASGLPPNRPPNNTSVTLEGFTGDLHAMPLMEFLQYVSPDYFVTMGIPLIAGRAFTEADRAGSAPVAIVNQRAAATLWAGRDPIGARIRAAAPGAAWFTVVGVVADVKQRGLAAPPGTELYLPYRQAPAFIGGFVPRVMNIVIRTSAADPASPGRAVRSALRAVDASLPAAGLQPMAAVRLDSIARVRFVTLLLGAFGLGALALAAVGTYGVMASLVGRRTREIGIRMALGAERLAVLRLVMREALIVTAAGVALGLAGGAFGARLLASFLFQVRPGDPLTLATVAALLALVGATAAYLPARRAARLDPVIALRDE
jgi:putative ABC transport system permease protein